MDDEVLMNKEVFQTEEDILKKHRETIKELRKHVSFLAWKLVDLGYWNHSDYNEYLDDTLGDDAFLE